MLADAAGAAMFPIDGAETPAPTVLPKTQPAADASRPDTTQDTERRDNEKETIMRLVGAREATLIKNSGGLIESNSRFTENTGETRLFEPYKLPDFLNDAGFADRTDLVIIKVRKGWKNHYSIGGAFLRPDFGVSWASYVDVNRINHVYMVGKPIVIQRGWRSSPEYSVNWCVLSVDAV